MSIVPKEPPVINDGSRIINLWVNGTNAGSAYRVSKSFEHRFFAYGIFKRPEVLASTLRINPKELFYNEAILPQFTIHHFTYIDVIIPILKGQPPVEGTLYYNLPQRWTRIIDPIEPESIYERAWTVAHLEDSNERIYTQAYVCSREIWEEWAFENQDHIRPDGFEN